VFGLVFLCREKFAESDTREEAEKDRYTFLKKKERRGRCK
jgi:hypothetical protein